jgi:hypothetical protein
MNLPKVKQILYLGKVFVTFVTSPLFQDNTMSSFYCVANAIFVRLGRIASDDLIGHLLAYKSNPVLLFKLETFSLTKADLNPHYS